MLSPDVASSDSEDSDWEPRDKTDNLDDIAELVEDANAFIGNKNVESHFEIAN